MTTIANNYVCMATPMHSPIHVACKLKHTCCDESHGPLVKGGMADDIHCD